MKNFFGLLLIVGLLIAGWMNRDQLNGLWGNKSTLPQETPSPTPVTVPPTVGHPAPLPPGTPHPAGESRTLVTKLYPGLSIPNSALNKKFVALYADAQRAEPELLAQPDWPVKLAERAVIALGGAPMPLPTPPPAARQFSGSLLDQKPGK